MPGGSKKGGGLETKKSTFYLKSGNSPLFKMMGSSPLKQEEHFLERKQVGPFTDDPTARFFETKETKPKTKTKTKKKQSTITLPSESDLPIAEAMSTRVNVPNPNLKIADPTPETPSLYERIFSPKKSIMDLISKDIGRIGGIFNPKRKKR